MTLQFVWHYHDSRCSAKLPSYFQSRQAVLAADGAAGQQAKDADMLMYEIGTRVVDR